MLQRLQELAEELDELDDEEKLEQLIELSRELPQTTQGRAGGLAAENCRVQECQTPVYLWVDVIDGRVQIEADVPLKSPTVRGLVTLAVQGLNGASAVEVLAAPDDLVAHFGLQRALGMQRQQGFRGVMARIKRDVQRQTVP